MGYAPPGTVTPKFATYVSAFFIDDYISQGWIPAPWERKKLTSTDLDNTKEKNILFPYTLMFNSVSLVQLASPEPSTWEVLNVYSLIEPRGWRRMWLQLSLISSWVSTFFTSTLQDPGMASGLVSFQWLGPQYLLRSSLLINRKLEKYPLV